MREGSTFFYFLTDHLGSVVGVTDSTGAMVSETRYLPFGEVRTDVGTVTQTDYGYTFQRNDSYIKLLDYRFRSYSPELGRFVSPDSIVPNLSNPQSLNRYSYVNNRPINFNDPSGHCPLCVTAAIGAGIGSVVGGVAYGIYSAKTDNFNWWHLAAAVGGGAAAGALIGTGIGWAAGVGTAEATTAAVTTGVAITSGINADGDPTNELATAVKIGQTAIEKVTPLNKISSQLTSKADLLNLVIKGDMSNLSNTQVQKGLSTLNSISSSPTCSIWQGSWISKAPTQVFEYIENGIGVVRSQTDGSLISVVSRVGPNLDKLQKLINLGKGSWLR